MLRELALFAAVVVVQLGVGATETNPCEGVVPLACENWAGMNVVDKLQCVIDKERELGEICVENALKMAVEDASVDTCSVGLKKECIKLDDLPEDSMDALEALECFAEKAKQVEEYKECKVDTELAHRHHHRHHHRHPPCPPGPYPPGPHPPPPPYDPSHHHGHHHHRHHHGHHGGDDKKDDSDDEDDDEDDEDDREHKWFHHGSPYWAQRADAWDAQSGSYHPPCRMPWENDVAVKDLPMCDMRRHHRIARIVGGVIGGIVTLALFFHAARRFKKMRASAAAAQAANPSETHSIYEPLKEAESNAV